MPEIKFLNSIHKRWYFLDSSLLLLISCTQQRLSSFCFAMLIAVEVVLHRSSLLLKKNKKKMEKHYYVSITGLLKQRLHSVWHAHVIDCHDDQWIAFCHSRPLSVYPSLYLGWSITKRANIINFFLEFLGLYFREIVGRYSLRCVYMSKPSCKLNPVI